MSSIELLLEEYKIVGSIGEKYFDRMYASLNYTIIYYGAILTLMFGAEKSPPATIIFHYFLPVGTYLFGLFYAYNSFAIAKQGFHSVRLELALIYYGCLENGKVSFYGWNLYPKKGGCYGFAYGTSLMFFILAPLFDYIWGLQYSNYRIIVKYTNNSLFNNIFSVLPISFYLIYMIFMVVIISQLAKTTSQTKKMRNSL